MRLQGGFPSDRVRAFVRDRIDSALQLEVLLLLYRDDSRSWASAEVAANLRIEHGWTDRQLVALRDHGLLVLQHGRFRYGPADPELRAAVDELNQAFAERPATLIAMIFSKPQRALQTFADAFRLKQPPGD
jgi:hypothetical protein